MFWQRKAEEAKRNLEHKLQIVKITPTFLGKITLKT